MSAKENSQEQVISLEQEIAQQKRDAFDRDLIELQNKHGVYMMPELSYRPNGVFPIVKLYTKEELDNMGLKVNPKIAPESPAPADSE